MDALFSGISAVVEMTIELLNVLFSGFGNLALACDVKRDRSERRKHAWLAGLKIGLPVGVILVIGVWIGYDRFQARQNQWRIESTRLAVEAYANELHALRDDQGSYQVAVAGRADTWDRPLKILYTPIRFGEKVSVTSAGPDGEYSSRDDIVAVRRHVQAKKVGAAITSRVKDLLDREPSQEQDELE